MYSKVVKRILDILISLLIIIIITPFILLLSIWIFIANKGSGLFFIQGRPGQNTKVFKLIKFKTMTDEKDESGMLLPDIKRLTKTGRFIRSTSLDELPQLFNVLKGDMSLVGPRPLLVKYLPLYSEFQARRHEVKPGMTGWAQVNGRNAISWKEKFELDVWYVDHITLLLDIKILIMTISKVFLRRDINSPTSATMDSFTGNE